MNCNRTPATSPLAERTCPSLQATLQSKYCKITYRKICIDPVWYTRGLCNEHWIVRLVDELFDLRYGRRDSSNALEVGDKCRLVFLIDTSCAWGAMEGTKTLTTVLHPKVWSN